MPDFAVTLSVILGFLACALLLRVLATAGTPSEVRVPRDSGPAVRAMMDE
ncbi:hypothetical protein NDR87_10135 [Nocardia sp. CDC159]|uniref:Uncharacterized protein n=1 Tax=Nocardia pulmonis TaxID=2951408 RepID=A0A9X2E566_9NOCA|nr:MULTISPECIES: hypothetical protein [Nocardia]MCM6773826.1 hypothetical protein [Nocardia pulmonis]MCM6786713.1 hypothetical protein [Nocardia sp. CDC159]